MYLMITETEIIARAQARRALRVAPALARDLRLRAGLSQNEVGAALGVSHAAVSRWKSGKRLPRGDLAERFLLLLMQAAGGMVQGPPVVSTAIGGVE